VRARLIFVASILMNKSPAVLVGSLGALTAILMLLFKDSILGLVAGVHLSANKMLARGDWVELPSHGADGEVLEVTRRRRKLRRGVQTGNRFRIRVQGVTGDRAALATRAAELETHGVPNYFGAQRFGHDGNNVARAWEMLARRRRVRDRGLRSIYLSAARAMLFNRVLARRVRDGSWQRALPAVHTQASLRCASGSTRSLATTCRCDALPPLPPSTPWPRRCRSRKRSSCLTCSCWRSP